MRIPRIDFVNIYFVHMEHIAVLLILVYYITSTYSYNRKFVPCDHIHPVHPPHLPPLLTTNMISFSMRLVGWFLKYSSMILNRFIIVLKRPIIRDLGGGEGGWE